MSKKENWQRIHEWFKTSHDVQSVNEVLRLSEKGFIRKYKKTYAEYNNAASDKQIAEKELREFHRAVSVSADKAKHVFFSLYHLSAGEMPERAGVLSQLPDFFDETVSYSDIFGNLAGTEDGLDLLSPAAYFADLMRIIETYITSEFDIPKGHQLRDRRPDLYTCLLTKENTETLLPYSDIVTERLVSLLQKLEPDVFQDSGKIKAYCASNVYPAALPFSEPYHTVFAALTKNGFNPSRILSIFKPDLSSEQLAAATFRISVDYLAALTDCGSSFYPELASVTDFRSVDAEIVTRTTGLSLGELDTLFARGIESIEEFNLAAPGFYINRGLSDCLKLSEDGKNVTGLTADSAANLIRFVRIAKLTELTYDQLDAIIVNDNISAALLSYAALKNLPGSSDDLLCLISSLYDYGPANTFKEVYGDRLSSNNSYHFPEILPVIADVLNLPENDITSLYSHLFGSSDTVSADRLNALYRNTYLAELLGLEVDQYITLTKLAGIKPDSLCGVFSSETISGLLSYNDLHSINAYEADYICTGHETSYANSGFHDDDFTSFIKDIKEQVAVLSEEKKNIAVRQGLLTFLGIKTKLTDSLFRVIPTAPAAFDCWEETFYLDEGMEFAYHTVKRLTRADLLLDKIPADLFELFAAELFTADFTQEIPYQKLVTLCRTASFYTANPIFFMLAADALKKKDKIALSALCALSEEEIGELLDPLELSLFSILKFVSRLDAVKTLNLSVTNLTTYLDALIKENNYGELLRCAQNLPVPAGTSSAYCKALTSLTVQKLREIYPDISTPDALSAYLLLDVQTDESVQASYIREGINAALTYLNRCRNGLEPGVRRISGMSEEYWSWIMDFSEWKANRMVFVNPENYLLPDIRSSQSSLFKKTLQDAAGKPLDLAEAEALYTKYLDEYAGLTAIIPCASYLASTKDSEQLYIFGRTQSSGGKLYYCIRKDGIWDEWTEVSASIPAAEITPIFIFGKLFIFWIEESVGAAPEISYSPAEADDMGNDTEPVLLQSTQNVTKFSVKYTCRNLQGSWSAAKTLFEDECVIENADTDYGKQFQKAYDTNEKGYKRLSIFRITERNFCDNSGRYYISQNSEFEKLLVMYGGFVYHFPNETIENYFPIDNPFDTQDKSNFSNKHAALCDKINILSNQNISGRLCSGSVRIYGSTLREERLVADGEFLIFDEYTGGSSSTVPAVTTDESSSVVSTVLTADVIKNTLIDTDQITPKFIGQALPQYTYTGKSGNYTGEFSDTLNTYVLGTAPDSTLKKFQNYLESVKIAKFNKSDSDKNETDGTVQINPHNLETTTFYASTSETGIQPAHFGDLYSILLQGLGSQNLFGSTDNRLATDAEIIKTANMAGSFILKTSGPGGEAFLMTPVPARTDGNQGKPAQLNPTDDSIVISYPKITADDIEKMIGDYGSRKYDIFDALHQYETPIIDIDGYIYTSHASEDNIRGALKLLFGEKVPETVSEGLSFLFNNHRVVSNYMFWSKNVNQTISSDIFAALTGQSADSYTVLPVDTKASLNTNPKVKLRKTEVIGTKTPSEVSSIYSQFINAPLPVSVRFRNKSSYNFDISTMKYDVTRLTNASLPYIIPAFSAGGVDSFLKIENQQAPIPTIYPIERFSPNTKALNLPAALDGAQPDFDGLYKNYNYELFYHIPIYAAKTLRDFGNYSDAKKWLEYIYSPLATEEFITAQVFTPVIPGKERNCISVLDENKLITASEKDPNKYRVKYGFSLADFDNSRSRETLQKEGFSSEEIDSVIAILTNYTLGGTYGYCWQFFPFRSRTIADLMEDLNDSAELRNYHNNPFDPHAIASLRIGAYEKYTVLEYVDLLIEWGDREFAKLTWDSIANASVLYNMANDVLGKRPTILAQRTEKESTMCFDDLYRQTESSKMNQLTELLETLTFCLLNGQDTGNREYACNEMNSEFFFPYFKIPANTAAVAKWDLVTDRLMKIRNNLDLNGNQRSIPLFSAAADPIQLARSRSAGYSSASSRQPGITNNWYRYSVLYAYAKEFCTVLIQFSSQLLSAIEKGDNEELRLLSAQQNSKMTAYTKLIKNNLIEELEKEKEALELAKTAAETRLNYFDNLVDKNISRAESAAIAQNIAAGISNAYATELAIAGGVGALIPEAGSPFAMVYGGRELSGSFMNFSAAAMSAAATLGTSAGVTATFAEYSRRLSEWKFQKELAQSDIDHIKIQMETNESRIKNAKYDLESTELLETQTAELMDFYQTKFSSYNLYGMLSGLLRRVVFNAYQTAIELSARAEMAWQEETDDNTSFLDYTYWDDAKCGILSGEALLSALDTMQAAYISKNPRRLEITKTVSLAEICPAAFAQLQSGNICSFTLPLSLFDDDKTPVNYLHKIKSVSINTQVVIGAYQNINAKLTQISNVILADPKLPDAVKYVAQFEQGGGTVPSGVIANRRTGQYIHISNAQNESGMHSYDPSAGAYLPFEGTGAVSQWNLEYGVKNPFSPKDVSDVVLNIAYTALPSGKG